MIRRSFRTSRRWSVATIALTLCALALPVHAEYLAHAVTDDVGKLPLPEDLSEIAAKRPLDLVQIEWSDYDGNKPRTRVLAVQNDSGQRNYAAQGTVVGPDGERTTYSYNMDADYQLVPVSGLEAMLADILIQTGRFRVVERETLGEIFAEQDLVDEGRVSQPSAAKKGKVLGAKLGVKMVVNSYEPNLKGKRNGLGGLGRALGGVGGAVIGGVNWSKTESRVAITMQLVDLETAEIKKSVQSDVRLKAKSIGFGGAGWGHSGALGGFSSSFAATSIGQAMIASMNKAIFELLGEVSGVPAEGRVADVDGSEVTVNLGEGIVAPNDTLTALARGKAIRDPDTGEVLSFRTKKLGELRVVEVYEKFAIAEAVDVDTSELEVGDTVQSHRAPRTYEYGPPWQLTKNGKRRK